jgi:LCP family protein required for cell wall assembly
VAEPFPEPIRESPPVAMRPRRPRRRRRKLRWVLTAVAVVLVLVAGAGAYEYRSLNGNIKHASLFTGTSGDAGTEKPDPFGRVPINLLVIGSDSRAKKADCKLGGGCENGTGENADVEMLVHVSADRSNITVMSVPRDTMVELPGCTDPATGAKVGERYGQINSSLEYGPGCTVAAVHKLTGITIDHFMMVDFAGVISVSDSVGGVSVCVSDNVYDPYSHLKLSKGKHILKGLAALEFVRSRHAFGDGSDLGRTYAQHVFLSSAIRSVKSKGLLLHPTDVLALAQAATKALTVDTGLGSIPKLLGLAEDVNKVPSDRVTFATMQTGTDPANPNRVVVAAAAEDLFAAIRDDESLSTPSKSTATPTATPSATPTPTPTPTATADVATIAVQVRNGSGRSGRATEVAATLTTKGFKRPTVDTFPTVVADTSIEYGPGQKVKAQTLAGVLKLPASALHSSTEAGLRLIIGTDWLTGKTYPSTSESSKAKRKAALSQAHSQTATASSCVPVSHALTVTVNGIPMTPIRAFDNSPNVKLSAR